MTVVFSSVLLTSVVAATLGRVGAGDVIGMDYSTRMPDNFLGRLIVMNLSGAISLFVHQNFIEFSENLTVALVVTGGPRIQPRLRNQRRNRVYPKTFILVTPSPNLKAGDLCLQLLIGHIDIDLSALHTR
jgi:hypothetical protein